MKSIYNENEKLELIKRINKLTPDTKPEWGKMNISQMLEHCTVSVRLALSEIKPELNENNLRLGKLVKDRIFMSEVFSKELPTTKEFIIDFAGDVDENKRILVEYLNKFSEMDPGIELKGVHPYFGELTMIEWSMLIWKHTNHHLIQFGV